MGDAGRVTLHVALQDGFESDRTVVEAGGVRRELAALRTRTQIGLADELTLDVDPGSVEVRVRLPDRGIDDVTHGVVRGESWLGVSVVGGALEFTWSEAPFLYA
jgi:hypothetical protein